MATNPQTIEFLLEQLASLPSVRARKMFGEYGLYCDEKVVGFVCDDQLFLKITDTSTSSVRTKTIGKPYPSAKDYYRIDENDWDDREYMSGLVVATANSLPIPKSKK